MTGYKTVTHHDLHIGDEIIVERKHFDYKRGFPIESDYYRAIVGEHRTVAGMAFHLVSEPSVEFPHIPPWAARWIYAENNEIMQMWRKE